MVVDILKPDLLQTDDSWHQRIGRFESKLLWYDSKNRIGITKTVFDKLSNHLKPVATHRTNLNQFECILNQSKSLSNILERIE